MRPRRWFTSSAGRPASKAPRSSARSSIGTPAGITAPPWWWLPAGRPGQPAQHALGIDRPAVVVALDLVAAEFLKEVRLLPGLDALGDHLQPEAPGQGQDGPGDGNILRVAGQILDEATVDLQGIDGQALQVAERGIAGAEVIDRHPDAELAEFAEGLHRRGQVLDQQAFGDLHLQEARLQSDPCQDLADPPGQTALLHLAPGEIHRHGDGVTPIMQAAGKAASLKQRPVAHLGDQPGLFQDGHKLVRRHRAEFRRVPAQQGLQTDYRGIGKTHLGLVEQAQFGALQGVAQTVFHLHAPGRPGGHVGGEELVVGTPQALGVVHRRIGIAGQAVGIAGIGGIQGDADTGADHHVVTGEIQRRGNPVEDGLGHLGGADGVVQAFQDHGEFVAAESRYGVCGTHAGAQTTGDLLEHGIADGVPQAVVDGLEVIQIDEHQAELTLVTRCLGHGMFQAVAEQGPVGQTGEDIVMRQELHPLLVLHALGDVLAGRDEMADPAVGILERRDGLFLVIQAAAFAPVDEHLAEYLAVHQGLPQLPIDLLGLAAGLEHGGGLAPDLVGPVAGHVLEGTVDILDAPVAVGDHHRVIGLRHGHAQFVHQQFGLAVLLHFALQGSVHPAEGLGTLAHPAIQFAVGQAQTLFGMHMAALFPFQQEQHEQRREQQAGEVAGRLPGNLPGLALQRGRIQGRADPPGGSGNGLLVGDPGRVGVDPPGLPDERLAGARIGDLDQGIVIIAAEVQPEAGVLAQAQDVRHHLRLETALDDPGLRCAAPGHRQIEMLPARSGIDVGAACRPAGLKIVAGLAAGGLTTGVAGGIEHLAANIGQGQIMVTREIQAQALAQLRNQGRIVRGLLQALQQFGIGIREHLLGAAHGLDPDMDLAGDAGTGVTHALLQVVDMAPVVGKAIGDEYPGDPQGRGTDQQPALVTPPVGPGKAQPDPVQPAGHGSALGAHGQCGTVTGSRRSINNGLGMPVRMSALSVVGNAGLEPTENAPDRTQQRRGLGQGYDIRCRQGRGRYLLYVVFELYLRLNLYKL
jgi:hypothetical protein